MGVHPIKQTSLVFLRVQDLGPLISSVHKFHPESELLHNKFDFVCRHFVVQANPLLITIRCHCCVNVAEAPKFKVQPHKVQT